MGISTSVEVTAPTVDEAIEKGLAQLGMQQSQVHVSVLYEGTGEVDPARVRLTPMVAGGPDDKELETVHHIVEELLLKMHLSAEVYAEWQEPEDDKEPRHIFIDVRGQGLSIMISRKAEALAALQYITKWIAARKLEKTVPVVIDIEGYREKREQQLRRMARRAAEQALERNRTVVLEPMPANERRVVHIELREHQGVKTESIGFGRQRKVTIIPK